MPRDCFGQVRPWDAADTTTYRRLAAASHLTRTELQHEADRKARVRKLCASMLAYAKEQRAREAAEREARERAARERAARERAARERGANQSGRISVGSRKSPSTSPDSQANAGRGRRSGHSPERPSSGSPERPSGGMTMIETILAALKQRDEQREQAGQQQEDQQAASTKQALEAQAAAARAKAERCVTRRGTSQSIDRASRSAGTF